MNMSNLCTVVKATGWMPRHCIITDLNTSASLGSWVGFNVRSQIQAVNFFFSFIY